MWNQTKSLSVQENLKALHQEIKAFKENHLYMTFLCEAVLITMFIELISRRSLSSLFLFIGKQPLTFWCNAFIVFLTVSLSTLTGSWRRFTAAVIMLAWIVLGVVNAIVLRYRMTPFSAEDFSMIPSLMRIAQNYLTPGTLILLVAAVLALVAGIGIMWKKLPKDRIQKNWFTLAGRCLVIGAGCFAFLNMGMQTQAISTDFMNLADAYEEYGFAYCFSTSIVDVGIDKPEGYSEEMLRQITAGMDIGSGASVVPEDDTKTASADQLTEGASAPSVSDSRPNIIMIQLESFFDPYYLKDYSFSEDPIPNFRAVKENTEQYASGFLTVPVVGAGTSNTEFEILTGMSCDYFGAGEYPYNTILKDTPVEALPQILRQYGYTSTAVHNNTGTFYNRNLVFANMGFDYFIPKEYMYDIQMTLTNWAKDNILTQIMLDVLSEHEGPDFIYTITVQSHGRYPSTKVLEDPAITVTCDNAMANVNALTYYVNMLREVDEMIGELMQALSEQGEPTVLVMFGDHLPALGFGAEDLSQPSLYQTEYVIWNNFGMRISGSDMQAETMETTVLQQFGMDNGIMPRFHEAYDGTDEYSDYLEMLEYDMLYGNGYVFGEEQQSYQASDLKVAYKPISVKSSELKTQDGTDDPVLFVYGENFNSDSRIIINDKVKTTEYIDRQTLCTTDLPKEIENLAVGQFDENLKQLGESIVQDE